jgi:hypothetical protein
MATEVRIRANCVDFILSTYSSTVMHLYSKKVLFHTFCSPPPSPFVLFPNFWPLLCCSGLYILIISGLNATALGP